MLHRARAHHQKASDRNPLQHGRNLSLIEKQAREFKPQFVSVSDENDAKKLRTSLADTDIEIGYGMDGLIKCATIEHVT